MRKKLAAILMVVLFPAISLAASRKLQCDPNTEPDLAGYKLYWGTQSGFYTQQVDTGKQLELGYTVTGLTDGYYCFVATAYDTSGNESGYSNEVCLQVDSTPPKNPVNLRIQQP